MGKKPNTTYVKIDDDMPGNAKLRMVPAEARWVYVASICYAGHNLTDGYIPEGALGLIDGTQKIARALMAADLWEPDLERGGGWQIHDYSLHNRTREQVASISQERSKAGSKGIAKRWQIATPLLDVCLSTRDLSSVTDTDLSFSENQPTGTAEIRSRVVQQSDSKLPSEFRDAFGTLQLALSPMVDRDATLRDECEQLAREYTAQQLAEGIAKCRRTKGDDGRFLRPYPGTLRQFLPEIVPADAQELAEWKAGMGLTS